MNTFLRYIFIVILIFSLYHLFRDILQILNLDSGFTDILHWDHAWCRVYCDFVTLPLDFIGIVGSIVVLRKNKLGKFGILTLASLPLWIIAILIP